MCVSEMFILLVTIQGSLHNTLSIRVVLSGVTPEMTGISVVQEPTIKGDPSAFP